MKDLKGYYNSYLKVIRYKEMRYRGVHYWICECKCGHLVERSTYEITSSKIKKCRNCNIKPISPPKKRLHKKRDIKSISSVQKRLSPPLFHGYADKHPLYKTWINMRQRCYNSNNPKFAIYGGKGIKLCEEWFKNFKSFFDWALSQGWKCNLTIDRVDPLKDYAPSNCRFITKSENTRRVHEARRQLKKISIGSQK